MTSEAELTHCKPKPKLQRKLEHNPKAEPCSGSPSPPAVEQGDRKMGVHVKPELSAEPHTSQSKSGDKPDAHELSDRSVIRAETGGLVDPQALDGGNQKNPYLPWAESEDEMIRKVIKELHVAAGGNPDDGSVPEMKSISWVKVSNRISGRSPKQCRERWRNALNPSINHCPWTLKEDVFLLNAQREFGNKWVKIASQLHGRTENGVKTRYKSIMRAKKRAWKKNEDSQLMSMYNHVGANWKEIAGSLPGRSVNGVKLRYRQLLSGTPNEPQIGSPEQALKVFYSCYGGSGSMPYSSEAFRLNSHASHTHHSHFNAHSHHSYSYSYSYSHPHAYSSSYSRSEGIDTLAGNRTATASALGMSSLDTIHPCKSRKRKGTRATLLDKLEKERAGRCKFSELMATLLAKVPEETQTDGPGPGPGPGPGTGSEAGTGTGTGTENGPIAVGVAGSEEVACSHAAPRESDMFLSEIMDFPASLESKPEQAKLTPF